MKAWQLGQRRGVADLQLGERDMPTPGPGEVRVRVLAAGLNYRDLMVANSDYGRDLPATRVPLSDGVGIVTAIGDGVKSVEPGWRVIAPHFVGWTDGAYRPDFFAADLGVTIDGWLGEEIILPAAAVIRVPDTVDDATAATFAVAGATVWHALVRFGAAGTGKLVLTQGTGGVAIFTLLAAKALGAKVAITSSSDAKLAGAQQLGADYIVNYRRRPDWAEALREATLGRGADVIVDTLGFSALGQTVAAAAVEGRIATVGALSGRPTDTASASQGALIGKNIAIKGIASGSRAMLVEALDLVVEKGLRVPVAREFAFGEAPDAYRHLAEGAHFGKLLIRMD